MRSWLREHSVEVFAVVVICFTLLGAIVASLLNKEGGRQEPVEVCVTQGEERVCRNEWRRWDGERWVP